MTAPRPEPQTEAGWRLLRDIDDQIGDVSKYSIRTWIADTLPDIEAQARAPLAARMREAVEALPRFRVGTDGHSCWVLPDVDGAWLERRAVLALIDAAAAPSTEPTRAEGAADECLEHPNQGRLAAERGVRRHPRLRLARRRRRSPRRGPSPRRNDGPPGCLGAGRADRLHPLPPDLPVRAVPGVPAMTPSETAPAPYRETAAYRRLFKAIEESQDTAGWEHWELVWIADAVVAEFPELLPPENRPEAPPVPAAADYEARVTAMADALHEDCRLEWQAIRAVGREVTVTQHGADAHYGKAHDLVRRLWPELDTAALARRLTGDPAE